MALTYYMDRSEAEIHILFCEWQTGPYTAIWPEVSWTICYIILNTCKSARQHVFVIAYLRQKTSSDKIRKKTLYWSGPVHIPKYWPVSIRINWPAALTKTNRENKNVKYHIILYFQMIVLQTYFYAAVYMRRIHLN
jgi:hypothetical protein